MFLTCHGRTGTKWKKKKQHWGFINHQGSIPDGWSRMAKEKKKKMKGSRGRKRSNQMKGWRRNGCGAGKMARYRRAHFLCRPIRHAGLGTEEGEWMEVQRVAAQGEAAEAAGVVGGEWWTVGLSHQGCLLTCATKRDIHQAGRRRRFTQPHGRGNMRRACRTHTHTKGHSDHSQGPLCITQKTLLHPPVWRDVPPHHF